MQIHEVSLMVFSPTGSGLKVADYIKDNIKSVKVKIINATYPKIRNKIELKSNSNIYHSVIFPIYADSLPDIFTRFLTTYDFNNNPVTIIAGYGNIYTGRALNDAQKIISANNGYVISASHIVFAHSYNSEKITIAENEPTTEKMNEIAAFINNSLNYISKINSNDLSQIPLPKGNKRFLSGFPQKFFPQIFIKKPDVIKSRCNNCNVCINVCPSGAINNDLSITTSLCIRCLACVKYCKKNARLFRTRTNMLITTLKKESRFDHKNEFFTQFK